MHIQSILCPVDSSDVSPRVVAAATKVARTYDATLTVLEVLEPTASLHVQSQEADAISRLETLAAPVRRAGVRFHVKVETGLVVPSILHRAAEISADLIVLGTHGRTGFDRLALGSVAEKIVRKAHCPVLTVPSSETRATPGSPWRTILCAVDLSPISAEVLAAAQDLAQRDEGRIVLVHAVPWPFETSVDESANNWKRTLEARSQEALEALIAASPSPAAAISPRVLTGVPRDAILAYAKNQHADLIVLGVSGHGALDRALLGSTAHGVVRRSACPVLTVGPRLPPA